MILGPITLEYKQYKWVLIFFLRFLSFKYRGLNQLELHCILTIEAWLNLNISIDCRYLDL